MTADFTTGADLFGAWLADVERGTPPVRFALETPFDCLDIRPGRMVLIGGAPGSGKTAALMQVAIDLLRLNPAARLLVANVEMSPTLLLERVASRLAAVPLTAIMNRVMTADELDRVRAAAWMAEQGAGTDFTRLFLTEAAGDLGLTPDDVARQIKCGVGHALKQQQAEGGHSP